MRVKEFFIRLCIAVPMVVWVIFLVMMLFGIIANLFGAGSLFYCKVYCKVAVYLLIATVAFVIYCQAKECCKEEKN
jgi:hypothetical protein